MRTMKMFALVLSLSVMVGCSAMQENSNPPELTPEQAVAQKQFSINRTCYTLGMGYRAFNPAINVVLGSNIVKVKVKDVVQKTNDAVVVAYDTCVTSAVLLDEDDVNMQIVAIAQATQSIAALIASLQGNTKSGDILTTDKNEVAQFTAQLITGGLEALIYSRQLRDRLRLETPISIDELKSLGLLLHGLQRPPAVVAEPVVAAG